MKFFNEPMRESACISLVAAVMLIGTVAATASQPSAVPVRLMPLWRFLGQAHPLGGFAYTIEDIVPSRKKPGSTLDDIMLRATKAPLGLGQMVKFLRQHLPMAKVWLGGLDRRVVHIAATKAFSWRANPLNHKFSFRGTLSLRQFFAGVVARRFPGVHFLYDPMNQGGVTFVGPQTPRPNLRAYRRPLQLDIKGMTLRRLLTGGLDWRPDPRHFGHSRWRADYTTRHGKFTGRVRITIWEFPVGTPRSVVTTRAAKR